MDLDPRSRHAIYLDTPALTAVRQVEPFFRNGIFNTKRCNFYIRRRPLVQIQKLFARLPSDLGISTIKGTALPLADDSVVFYPFNAQSNMNVVTQRQFHHVLTLHGESNKAASYRPAARLYDYICVAGPLAIDRYLENGIFTRADVENGRLIQMGDSFVQSIPWLKPAGGDTTPLDTVFYCPTWEGFGHQTANYSSVRGQRGFEVVAQAARALDLKRILIKPHPYQGLLRPHMWRDFIAGTHFLQKQGFDVHLALWEMPAAIRTFLQLALRNVSYHQCDVTSPLPVRLGITDVSGMEAVLLSANIPALTIQVKPSKVNERIAGITPLKYVDSTTDVAKKTLSYLERAGELDIKHRACIFGWENMSLAKLNGPERLDWLIAYVQKNIVPCHV